MNSVENIDKHKTNSILKGSKLTGDILISYDLQLDGDVEGKITAEQQSNVVIKGNCRGSINVKEGNVDIEGQMSDGDIIAGGNVSVTGTFNGGKIEAKGKISVNGKFNGTLNGREIEIGPDAEGTGDLFYRESISIAKGASVEIQIKKTGELQKKPKELADAEVVNIEPSVREAIG
jgi:cytoskeletal protein CcmA (bactofilin family)